MKIRITLIFVFAYLSQVLFAQVAEQDLRIIDSIKNILDVNSPEIAKHYNDLSYCYAVGDNKLAMEYARMALVESRKYNQEFQIGRAYKQVGLIFKNIKENDSANSYLNTSLKYLLKYDDYGELGDTYRYLSVVNVESDTSYYFLTEAIKYYKKCPNKVSQLVEVLNQISFYFANRDKHKESLEYLNEAQDIMIESGDLSGLHKVYENKANVYLKLHQYDRSYDLYMKSEKEAKKYNIEFNIGTLANKASLYSQMDSLDKAIETYGYIDSLLRAQDENHSSLPYVLRNMCIFYRKKGAFIKALTSINEAIERLEKMNNNKSLLQKSYASKGSLYIEMKNYKKAAVAFDKAMEITDEMGDAYKIKLVMQGGTLAHIHNRNFDKALEYFENYYTWEDSVRDSGLANKISEMEAKYETKLNEHKIQKLEAEKAQHELTIKNERKNRQLISILAVLFTMLGASSTLIYRNRQKHKRSELARTKAEIENRLLRVQMNPHFMFNSLNSVQSYIASNQNELAEDYLARFAQLTRAILNNSREDFILLSNEVETLQTYLDLEQQRFNHAFNFTVEIDDEVDEDLLKVPPMLIQPYVENAIIHGVAPLKQNGEIKLSFKPNGNENSVLCTVEDNGIGREASSKINKGSKHKSLGLQVTKERFELIKQQTGVEVKAEIIDLPEGEGTRVEMTIPFLQVNFITI